MGGRGQIGDFRYTPLIGPDILSGILANSTGRSVLDLASENLFSPLGITVARSLTFQSKEEQMAFNTSTDLSGWASDPAGNHTGGWGLSLSPVDMAKIGQLYLNGGVWNGKQIVSKSWIEESTKEHSRWEKCNLPYGYLWWLSGDTEQGFSAMGDGGNVIYVNTHREMVVSIASLFAKNVKDRIAFIKDYVEPAFDKDLT